MLALRGEDMHITPNDKGKPTERCGRKATGLRAEVYDSGVTESGAGTAPGHGATGRRSRFLPVRPIPFCSTHRCIGRPLLEARDVAAGGICPEVMQRLATER